MIVTRLSVNATADRSRVSDGLPAATLALTVDSADVQTAGAVIAAVSAVLALLFAC